MTDEPIRPSFSANYRDMREDGPAERAFIAPHHVEEGGALSCLHPAGAMTLSQFHDGATGKYLPTIRMTCLMHASGLVFVPTADECRALSQMLGEMADKMEKEARDVSDAAFARAAAKRD